MGFKVCFPNVSKKTRAYLYVFGSRIMYPGSAKSFVVMSNLNLSRHNFCLICPWCLLRRICLHCVFNCLSSTCRLLLDPFLAFSFPNQRSLALQISFHATSFGPLIIIAVFCRAISSFSISLFMEQLQTRETIPDMASPVSSRRG